MDGPGESSYKNIELDFFGLAGFYFCFIVLKFLVYYQPLLKNRPFIWSLAKMKKRQLIRSKGSQRFTIHEPVEGSLVDLMVAPKWDVDFWMLASALPRSYQDICVNLPKWASMLPQRPLVGTFTTFCRLWTGMSQLKESVPKYAHTFFCLYFRLWLYLKS